MSLPTRGAWIEIGRASTVIRRYGASLPTRGAWIEIKDFDRFRFWLVVAPHAGSVD